MRNLKRVLALSLAMVMLLGMMVIGAGAASADFTDASEITYVEAVDVLTAIGVMEGIPVEGADGLKFDPGMILTRAQAAAMMTRIIAGPANAAKVSANAEQIFIDVPSTHWAAGYIRYCANLGLLAGYEGYFYPDQNLTGVAFAKMLLVALGYNAEYEGYTNAGDLWASNVGTDAIANGIDLDGILLSDEVNRQQAAQMVFQFLEADMVDYTQGYYAGTVYPIKADLKVSGDYDRATTGTDDTLQAAEAYFAGLEKFNGVVLANEYADLEDDTALAAGKTKIGDKQFNYASLITDIGESRKGWAYNNNVIYIADTGKNQTWENAGAATSFLDRNGNYDEDEFEEITGLVDAADDFINFHDNYASEYKSDYRLEYVIRIDTNEFDGGDDLDGDGTSGEWEDQILEFCAEYEFDPDNLPSSFGDWAQSYFDDGVPVSGVYEWTDIIRKETALTDAQVDNIEDIFAIADKIELIDISVTPAVVLDYLEIGEVYVGTKSTEDISDEISWKTFKKEYLADDGNDYDCSAVENGEWLKVIDNNGDGRADYVFVLEFAMAELTSTTRGNYTMVVDVKNTNNFDVAFNADGETLVVDGDDVVAGAELARGDVVLFTYIDGKCYIDLPVVAVETVDKKGVDRRAETITCGGVEYGQSGIDYGIVDTMRYFVTQAEEEVQYDLYLDHFGYVRMYTETAYDRGFALLTDGWYWTNVRDEAFKVTTYDLEAGELVDVDVNDSRDYPANEFVYDDIDWVDAQEEAWGRLKYVDVVYNNCVLDERYITSIAAFTSDEDGAYTLGNIEDRTDNLASNKIDYMVQELDVTDDTGVSTKTWDTTVWAHPVAFEDVAFNTNYKVQATAETQYYLVIKDVVKGRLVVDEVITWVGYKNAPDNAALGDDAVAYAVTVPTSTTGTYNRAEVIVFECYADDPTNIYLAYERTGVDEYVTIGYDADAAEWVGELAVDAELDNDIWPSNEIAGFYEISEAGNAAGIWYGYADEDIYAGVVRTGSDVQGIDYFRIDVVGDSYKYLYDDGTPIFIIEERNGDLYASTIEYDDVEIGDEVIVHTDSKGVVLYAVNVAQSDETHDEDYDFGRYLGALVNGTTSFAGHTFDQAGDDWDGDGEVDDLWAWICFEATLGEAAVNYTVNGVGEYDLDDEVPVIKDITDAALAEGTYARVSSSIEDPVYELVDDTGMITVTVTGHMTVDGSGYYRFFLNDEAAWVDLAANAHGGNPNWVRFNSLIPADMSDDEGNWALVTAVPKAGGAALAPVWKTINSTDPVDVVVYDEYVETGFYQVELEETTPGEVTKYVATDVVYDASGDAIAAGTELTVGDLYYAKAGVIFKWYIGAGAAPDGTYTVVEGNTDFTHTVP